MKHLENLEKKAGAFKSQAQSLKEAIYLVALVRDTDDEGYNFFPDKKDVIEIMANSASELFNAAALLEEQLKDQQI